MDNGSRQIVAQLLQLEGKEPEGTTADLETIASHVHGYRQAYLQLNSEVGNLRSERDGYKRSYDIIAKEVSLLRSKVSSARSDGEVAASNGLPSILAVTLPKSGTKYIGASLALSLGHDYGRAIATFGFPKNVTFPEMLVDFARGGMLAVNHLQADKHNLRALKSAGITRFALQIRDPRACLHSWLHYFPAEAAPKLLTAAELEAYRALTRDQEIERHIEEFYRDCLDWLIAWVDVMDNDPDLQILPMTYDELAADERAFFQKIFKFYGLEAALAPAPRTSAVNFRSGSPTEWRERLPSRYIERMNAMMPDLLWRRFGWQK